MGFTTHLVNPFLVIAYKSLQNTLYCEICIYKHFDTRQVQKGLQGAYMSKLLALPTSSQRDLIGHAKNGLKPQTHTYLDTRVINAQRETRKKEKGGLKSVKLQARLDTKKHVIRLARELKEKKLADKVKKCHSKVAWLTCGKHVYKAIPNFTCECRVCPNCARRQANKKFNKYHLSTYAFAKVNGYRPMHLVLTQKKIAKEGLQDSVTRLMTAYRKLIRRSIFKEYFKGGLWSIEFTFDGNAYHTHLHMLVFRSKFIDVDLLRAEWAAVGGGENLRLTQIPDISKGLREVLKYIAKPIDIGNFTSDNLRDILDMGKKHFFGTFGGEFRKFNKGFNEGDYSELFSDLEMPVDVSDLEEGHPCPDCGDELFQIRQSERGYIKFLELLESSGRSP